MSELIKWQRLPQEQIGKYFFSSELIRVTEAVAKVVHLKDVIAMLLELRAYAELQNGINQLQIFELEDGRQLYYVDNLNEDELASNDYDESDNFSTLMWREEHEVN